MNRELDFNGKKVFVSGGSRGIGLGIARAFASRAADVAITSRELSTANQIAGELNSEFGGNCIGLGMNVADSESVNAGFQKIAENFGHLDIIINNAGVANSIAFEDTGEDDWNRIIDTNLKGVYLCCRSGLAIMAADSAIVNIASISGSMVNVPQFQANYNTSKAGVIMLSKSLAVEYASKGIRVNTVSPGYTRTAMNERPEVADLIEQWKARTPMKRLAEIEEIASAVLFLASSMSSFITGQDLVVDGGITLLC